MIARIWHGWTKRSDAKTYENMLCNEIFPSIAARNIKGYRGADETKPVIFPGVEKLVTRMEPARHYRIAITREL
jgi:hypothetical protein